jgi:hypothetical protein
MSKAAKECYFVEKFSFTPRFINVFMKYKEQTKLKPQ